MYWKTITAIMAAVLLSSCSATVYTDEAKAVASAASAFASSYPPEAKLQGAARDVVSEDDLSYLLLGDGVRYDLRCEDRAYNLLHDFVGTLQKTQDDQDQAFAGFAKLDACALDNDADNSTSDKPDAKGKPDGKGKKPVPKTDAEKKKAAAEDEARARKEALLIADERAFNASSAATRTTPIKTPDCAPSCNLEDYAKQISAYAAGVQAVISGKDVEGIQKGLTDGNKALGGLVSAAGGNPLATTAATALTTVAGLAIQEAQYEALKALVYNFDETWREVGPTVVRAARVRAALYIYYKAAASEDAAATAQDFLNNPTMYKSPADRLHLFESLNALVDKAAAALADTAKNDPATAFQAVYDANHALAAALGDAKRQIGPLGDALKTLNDQAIALKKATAPAAKK